MGTRVTAVITTRGRPAQMEEALASVRLEAHGDLEIVVVDDAGGAAPVATPDRPVLLVRGDGSGVAQARNRGLSAASGEYIIFLDDDDVALPHRITTLLAAAEERQAAVSFGMTRRVTAGGTRQHAAVPTNLKKDGPVGFCELLACAPHVNSVLARTDVLRGAGGFDAGADHFDDWSLWLRIAAAGATITCVRQPVAEWRMHEEGLTGKVLRDGSMKDRLLTLFAHLHPALRGGNAHAVRGAIEIVREQSIITYDDYAGVMADSLRFLHSTGTCFGGKSCCRQSGTTGSGGPFAGEPLASLPV